MLVNLPVIAYVQVLFSKGLSQLVEEGGVWLVPSAIIPKAGPVAISGKPKVMASKVFNAIL